MKSIKSIKTASKEFNASADEVIGEASSCSNDLVGLSEDLESAYRALPKEQQRGYNREKYEAIKKVLDRASSELFDLNLID